MKWCGILAVVFLRVVAVACQCNGDPYNPCCHCVWLDKLYHRANITATNIHKLVEVEMISMSEELQVGSTESFISPEAATTFGTDWTYDPNKGMVKDVEIDNKKNEMDNYENTALGGLEQHKNDTADALSNVMNRLPEGLGHLETIKWNLGRIDEYPVRDFVILSQGQIKIRDGNGSEMGSFPPTDIKLELSSGLWWELNEVFWRTCRIIWYLGAGFIWLKIFGWAWT